MGLSSDLVSPLRMTRLLLLLLAALMQTLVAGERVLGTLSPDAASATGVTNITSDNLEQIVLTVLQQNLPEGVPRLVIMRELPAAADVLAPKICGGLPGIVVRSSKFPSNGACFLKPVPANNLSCSCLEAYKETDTSWEFRLEAPPPQISPFPAKVAGRGPFGVGSLLLFGLPPTVTSLKLIGVEKKPLPMDFKKPPFPGVFSGVAIIQSTSNSDFNTIFVDNLDLSSVIIKSGFVPSSISNLTLRNCNIEKLSNDFLNDLDGLEYLDVSGNKIDGVFQDIKTDTCEVKKCPLKHLNLTNNGVKEFPGYLTYLTQLQSLSLVQNPITNYTVSRTTAEGLKRLEVLEMDAVTSCSAGQLENIKASAVCVLSDVQGAATGPSAVPAVESNSTNTYLMYAVIGGCIIVAVLVFALVKRSSCRSSDNRGKDDFDGYFDNTLSYEDTHPTISASLLNDPIIITNRIPYKEIRVANCISKGGFGLVYSGVYNRRRVAIKKIRPDRAGDVRQIESFLKEICLMATLTHPRIVEFVGVSWDSLRNLCAVTEFMDRGDLRDVLHGFKLRNNPLKWENHKTMIALHIAEALTYLHTLDPKVIHRDLKSKNVLLNSDLHAKLSDFGISRERHFEETHMTAGIGTSFWIAPEVLLGKDYDERADIFSFGVVLSEIDTDDYPYWNGDNPNVGNRAQENMILQMVASGAMRPTFSDDCPPAILELANKCLKANPEERPTAAEIVHMLQRVIQFMPPQPATMFIE
ncbi:hypothetical protein PINS_up002417 [Pythium insidiosum]|nr:hypothetical protein PINS_up002417 [Pythium insidiosum]